MDIDLSCVLVGDESTNVARFVLHLLFLLLSGWYKLNCFGLVVSTLLLRRMRCSTSFFWLKRFNVCCIISCSE